MNRKYGDKVGTERRDAWREAGSEKEHSRLKKRRMNKEPKKYYKAYAVKWINLSPVSAKCFY